VNKIVKSTNLKHHLQLSKVLSVATINLLSMESHHFFDILILAKIIEMQVRERTIMQNIKKW
jgi:hypothetical protein